MDTATRMALKKALDKIARKDSPFDERHPTNEAATWVKPELVCEVRFTEKTADCQLRHPVFIAIRTDKPASEIFWEVSEPAKKAVAQALKEDAQEKATKPRAARAKATRTQGRRTPAHTLPGSSSSPRRPAGTSHRR
jgi:bifunctional non-homologous end joining protein LigD